MVRNLPEQAMRAAMYMSGRMHQLLVGALLRIVHYARPRMLHITQALPTASSCGEARALRVEKVGDIVVKLSKPDATLSTSSPLLCYCAL